MSVVCYAVFIHYKLSKMSLLYTIKESPRDLSDLEGSAVYHKLELSCSEA